MKLLFGTLCLFLSCSAFAKGPSTKPATRSTTKPLATIVGVESAISKCDVTVHNAEAVEKSSELKAYEDLLHVIQSSLKAAINAGDLNRSNLLNEKLKEVKGHIDVLNGDAIELIVYGNRGWQEFGPVKEGQKLSIDVFGQWSDDQTKPERICGPEGIGGRWMLIGQIAEEGTFTVGKHLDLTVSKTAELRLGMSDSAHINGGGKLTLIVRTLR